MGAGEKTFSKNTGILCTSLTGLFWVLITTNKTENICSIVLNFWFDIFCIPK